MSTDYCNPLTDAEWRLELDRFVVEAGRNANRRELWLMRLITAAQEGDPQAEQKLQARIDRALNQGKNDEPRKHD